MRGPGAVCAVCARPLSRNQKARGKTCDDPGCRWTAVRRYLVASQEERRRLVRTLRAYRKRTLGGLDAGPPGSYPLAILPFNERALARLPRQRREAFGENLRRIVTAAGEDPVEPDADEAARTGPVPPTVSQACATCGGDCCPQEANDAFLDEQTVRRTMRARPDLDEDGVAEAYLRHVGDVTYDGSCVYHGANGCTLPRAMRSNVCNTWLCEGLQALETRLEGADSQRAFLVATREKRVTRWRLLDDKARPIADGGATRR